MKILFCTDGSKISYEAISNFTKWFNSVEADIISVSDMTYLPDNILLESDKYVQKCALSTHSTLEYSKKYLEGLNIKVNNILPKCGNAVDLILDEETKSNYDYLVLGSNGKRGFQKWLGSVSQEVASNSAKSVYISKNTTQNENILFPITYSGTSFENLKKVIENMNLTNAKIHLLNIYEIPDFLFLEGNIDSNWVTDVEIKQQKEAKSILNSVEMLFMNRGISVASKTAIKGLVYDEIIKYITDNSISLVITGMRKRKAFNGFVFSSVSRRILENANCDVLIYK